MLFLWQQFKHSSVFVKLMVLGVLAVWAVALGGVTALLIVAGGRSAVAQPPAPDQVVMAAPLITVSPPAGPLNTLMTVSGQNWTPGSTVLIYLNPGDQIVVNSFAVNSVVADSAGRFETSVTIAGGGVFWQAPQLVRVVARSSDSDSGAEALFNLIESAAPPAATALPTEIATAVPTPGPTAVTPAVAQLTATANVNIRSGPGTGYPVIGLLASGQRANVTGLSPDGRWWQIEFAGTADGRGWVAGAYASVQNVSNVPLVQPQPLPVPPTATPLPTPTPTPPVVITDWRGEYFDNPNLSGNPVLVRNDTAVNFNWGLAAPAAGLPADNFSVRWSRAIYAPAGTFRFTIRADDGVRLWVDDVLLIDQWRDTSATTYTADINLSDGVHTVKIAYYDRTGDAVIQLGWETHNVYPDWRGEYFNNRNLSGSPILVRNDTAINFNWGNGSPAPNLPADDFSVRWTRKLDLPGGTYRLTAKVDDGVRLWVDDVLIIDSWQNGSTRQVETTQKVNSGQHRFRVEYYEHTGSARIEINWQKVEVSNQPPQAILAGPYSVNEGSGLTFDGRASRDPDGNITTYEWDFAYDGKTFKPQATGSTAGQSFADGPATVTIALRVTDNKGASHIAAAQVLVQNMPPSVETGGPYNGLAGNVIMLVGAAIDPGSIDQASLAYHWDFGDGTGADGAVVTHAYNQPGVYPASLTVTDKDGGQTTKSTTVTVTKPNQPPQAVILAPTSAVAGDVVTFSSTGSGDADGVIAGYNWDFGDGNTASGAEATHTFTAAGSYLVSLTVTDDGGLTATTRHAIEITEAAPDTPPESPAQS